MTNVQGLVLYAALSSCCSLSVHLYRSKSYDTEQRNDNHPADQYKQEFAIPEVISVVIGQENRIW